MKKKNLTTGKLGEEIAEKFLKSKNYQIIDKNWGNKFGEIDLICRKNNIYVFVEVKTKVGDYFGTPENMFDQRKLFKVKKMANAYLTKHGLINTQSRIDVVAITLDRNRNTKNINHYEAVY